MHEHRAGCADLHKFHVHGHVDGEELLDGVRLPQDQGVLQGKARTRVPGIFDQEYQQYLEYQVQTRGNQFSLFFSTGGGHEVGSEGRDD